MTHPRTPREKVALKPCPFCGGNASFDQEHPHYEGRMFVGCDDCCAEGEPLSPHQYSAEEQVAVWNRRTALASGSGDHSGGVTDMIGSGDHAELARGKACGDRMIATADALMPWLKNYPPSTRRERAIEAANAAIAASCGPLLAEIAALGSKLDDVSEQCGRWIAAHDEQSERAAEAERKLAEAEAVIRDIAETPYTGSDWPRSRAATHLASKEAERGPQE